MTGSVILLNTVDGVADAAIPRPWLPLSILSIASWLSANGIDVEPLDPQIHPDWQQKLAARVPDARFLGVTALTGASIRVALRAIEIARAVAPQLPIVWGGYHASLAFRAILEEGLADVVAIGGGEEAALALAMRLHAGQGISNADLSAVPNIAYKPDGVVRATKRVFLKDMNALAPMNYDLLPPSLYYNDFEKAAPYITSYGCPYACSYCSEPTHSGRRWRPLSPERVVEETVALHERYRPELIDLMDPNWSSDPRRIADIVAVYERRGAKVPIACNMRSRDVLMVQERIDLTRLARIGVFRVFIGVESGSDRLLTELHKGSSVSDAVEACVALSAAGIGTYTSFMHDLPGESEDDSAATLRLAERLARLPGNMQGHNFYMPFPGTRLYDEKFLDVMAPVKGQSAWSKSTTKGAPELWRGRPAFRHKVVDALGEIQARHPDTFALTRLPNPGDP